jgi:hypothetical protein
MAYGRFGHVGSNEKGSHFVTPPLFHFSRTGMTIMSCRERLGRAATRSTSMLHEEPTSLYSPMSSVVSRRLAQGSPRSTMTKHSVLSTAYQPMSAQEQNLMIANALAESIAISESGGQAMLAVEMEEDVTVDSSN